MSENGEIYTAGKNFTLSPALTGWTNSTSDVCTDVRTLTTQIDIASSFAHQLVGDVQMRAFEIWNFLNKFR